jgi:hypothetical protein
VEDDDETKAFKERQKADAAALAAAKNRGGCSYFLPTAKGLNV